MVNSKPAGTVFCFASGTYVLNHYITLKDSNQFICPVRRTCVLTGLDQFRGALTVAYGTAHQVIRGFVVEHFIAAAGQWPNAGLQVRHDGLIEDNESRYNHIGIAVDSEQTIRGNYIHHNVQYGINGGLGNNIVIEGNELAWNNTGHLDQDDAGGSKVIGGSPGTNFLTWRRNYVHDNWGNGIWSDGNVRNVLYEENVVENNGAVGIDHEISWDAVIRNNTLRNNNTFDQGQGRSCWHGAEISLNNSQNVSIYGNTVEAVGINPICLANSIRSERAEFPQFLGNISVTNNIMKMRGAVNVGFVGATVPPNVTFSGNTYFVDVLSHADWTHMTSMTSAQWQAAGQDKDGKFLLW
jgi:parallel beta-helix repeat protein